MDSATSLICDSGLNVSVFSMNSVDSIVIPQYDLRGALHSMSRPLHFALDRIDFYRLLPALPCCSFPSLQCASSSKNTTSHCEAGMLLMKALQQILLGILLLVVLLESALRVFAWQTPDREHIIHIFVLVVNVVCRSEMATAALSLLHISPLSVVWSGQ